MNSQAILISSIVADYSAPPSFVERSFGEPLFHAESEVIDLVFHADGTLWSMEEAGILRQWNTEGHLLARVYLSDLEDIWRFSPTATYVASGANEIALWSVAEGRELTRIPTEQWVTAFAFHPTDKVLATGHDDGSICLFQLPELKLVKKIPAHSGQISAMAFNADGSQLASSGDDKRIYVWHGETLEKNHEFSGHTDRIPALTWHPTENYLVSVGWDTTARVWETTQVEPSILLNTHSDQVTAARFNAGGQFLACADSDMAIHVWGNPRQAQEKFVLRGHTDLINCLAFQKSGLLMASAGADCVIHIWNLETGKLAAGPTLNSINNVAFRASSGTLYSTAGGVLRAYDATTTQLVPASTTQPLIAADNVAISPDQQLLVVCGKTERLQVLDPQNLTPIRTYDHTKGPIANPVFSRDSQTLATCSQSDGLVWVWKRDQEEAVLVIPEAADGCTLEALSFSPDGRFIAVGGIDFLATSGTDGSLCVWDLEEKDKKWSATYGVTALDIDSTGKYIAIGTHSHNDQNKVYVLDFATSDVVFELSGHHDRLNAVRFSPDGSYLISAGDDGTIRVWNVLSGRIVVARQSETVVQSLVFSPDGKSLYVGNANTTSYQISMQKLLED
ncbi:MAG: WD40 repeat domain-containing protein [Zavarzinella sp.]